MSVNYLQRTVIEFFKIIDKIMMYLLTPMFIHFYATPLEHETRKESFLSFNFSELIYIFSFENLIFSNNIYLVRFGYYKCQQKIRYFVSDGALLSSKPLILEKIVQ